jgi:hypothetical protein
MNSIVEVPRARGICIGISVITAPEVALLSDISAVINTSTSSSSSSSHYGNEGMQTTPSISNDKASALEFGDIVLTRRIGFAEVIVPGTVRNDLYVTLEEGDWSADRKDKNIELTVQVIRGELEVQSKMC